MKIMKDKSFGGIMQLAATALTAAAAIIYAIFGVTSGTFNAGILCTLVAAAAVGALLVWKKLPLSELISVVMTVIQCGALTLFIRNSVGDCVEMITPVGMYGNADNMGMRFVILGFVLAAIVASIVEGFAKKNG